MIDQEYTTDQFLGNSQSFVATIATIVAMCVLSGDSNFILQIIRNIVKQLESEFNKKIKEADSVDVHKITNHTSYKYLKVCYLEKKGTEEQLKEAEKLYSKISIWQNSILLRRPGAKFHPNTESNGFHIPPFYSLIFIMVMFSIDELIMTGIPCIMDFSLIFLSTFSFLSYLYWIIRWWRFNIKNIDLIGGGYRDMFSSLLYIIGLSFILSIITYFLIDNSDSYFSFYTISIILKYSCYIFVITNGLIIPFLIPYCKYKAMWKQEIEKPKNFQAIIDKELNDWIKKIEELIKDIPA